MKKLSPLFLFLFSGSLLGVASPLTPEEAIKRVNPSFEGIQTRSSGDPFVLNFTLTDHDDVPSLYVFNRTDSEGFVVVSADDAAYPVLGYSESGSFDSSRMPSDLRYWLTEYSRQIQHLRETGATTANQQNPVFAGMEAIAPMVKSKWNQGAPYNTYCYIISPSGEETKSVTGCVATAMAQIMYYYQYPEIGHGSISYKHADSGEYSMDFGAQPFDWGEMLPTYYPDSYTQAQGDAVAYLMKACGYSVKMDYSKGDAGANGANIAGALIDYFGYDDAIQIQTRDFYTYNDWATMIYNNLKNVGPLVYDGSAIDGGHSFICDGYDGNGYFHFNWGWGGMSDGYYLLDALNPDEFGIGGAAGGYNLGQQVILNISNKDVGSPEVRLMQFGNVVGRITGNVLSLALEDASDPGLQYINPTPVNLTLGLEVKNVTNASQAMQYFQSSKKDVEAKQGSFFKWEEYGLDLDLSKVDMTEGDEYNFVISVNHVSGDTSLWSEAVAMPGKANYVTVKKTATGYQLTNQEVGNITVSDFKILSSPVYLDKPVEFSGVFTNNTSGELTRNYSAVFFNTDGVECYKMENYSINVDAGQTLSDSWTSVNWYKETGATDIKEDTQFKVRLYDNWQGTYVDGIEETVTVSPTNSEAKVESEFTIENATMKGEVYVVEGNELSVSLRVKVIEGFFNHTIMLAIQSPLSDGDYFTIMHKHFDAIPNLSAGEEQVFNMSVVFDDAEPGKTYRVEVWGPGSGFNETKLVEFDLSGGGINNISSDPDGLYRVYDIEGRLITTGKDIRLLKELPHGIYIVNGKKIII